MKKWGGRSAPINAFGDQSISLPDEGEGWGLEELVEHANRLLPRYLPEQRDDRRVRDAVNARLVRHLTTLGVLDEAGKEGREARYGLRHLLQLLVARRLMAEGYTTSAIKRWTAGASHISLQDLLQRGLIPEVTTATPPASPEVSLGAPDAPHVAAPSSNPALDYLRSIREGRGTPNEAAVPLSRSRQREAPRHTGRPLRDREDESAGFGAVKLEEVSELEAPAPVSQWERITVEAGLEVHVRDDWRLPPTPHERDELLSRLLEQLKRITKKRR